MEKIEHIFTYRKILLNEIVCKKHIWIILIIALVLSFLTAWLENTFNLSRNHQVLGAFGTLLSNVAFGYIAGVVFYVFSDLLPYCQRKYRAENRMLIFLETRLKFEMEDAICSRAYNYRKDKDAFFLKLINMIVENDNPDKPVFNSLNELNQLTPISLNKDKYNAFLFDLERSGKSAKFLINNYSEFLSFKCRDVLLDFIDLKRDMVSNVRVNENNNNIWLHKTNLKYLVERFVKTKFEVDEMINSIYGQKYNQ